MSSGLAGGLSCVVCKSSLLTCAAAAAAAAAGWTELNTVPR